MEPVYIDSVFFLNLLADYLICLSTARVCGVALKRLRYLLAAAIGGAYAVAVFLPGCGFLTAAPVKLAAALLICIAAFGGEEKPWRCAGVFFAVSAAFGGAAWALAPAGSGSQGIYLPISRQVLFVSFALCYALLNLIFRRRAALMARGRVQISVELHGRSVEFIALRDSGNSLYEPVSGKAVLIASPHALAPLFPHGETVLSITETVDMLELADSVPELKGCFRALPYSTLGGNGLLPIFTPDRILVEGREDRELLIAVSPRASGEGFEAIL